MFPTNTALDVSNCLSSLVGIRSQCSETKKPSFFIEDVIGTDLKSLSELATPSVPSGKDLGNWLIDSAARVMLGDMESMLNGAVSMNNIVGNVCSQCSLLPVYTSNSGVTVKSTVASQYQNLQITRLEILANQTGKFVLCFNDGLAVEKIDVQLQAGVRMPVNLLYETQQKKVQIYFEDTTVQLGQVTCPVNSNCGCGSSSATASPVNISGYLAGNEVSTQYGFLVCASVGCSYNSLICSMINQAPNLFGLALLYKVGESLTVLKSQTARNNTTASFSDGTEAPEHQLNYGQLYWAKLNGTKSSKGVKHIVGSFLQRNRADKCVTCEPKIYTATAVG